MKEEIDNALKALTSDGTILYPTDTVWGLGCDATSRSAIAKIFEIKNRPAEKSMILLVADERMLQNYVKEIPEICWELLDAAEDPLTIIYPGAINLPEEAINADGTVAIRIPKNEFCKKLITRLKHPLVSTSANLSGEPSPKDFGSISREILDRVDYIVNLGQHQPGSKPSSIIKVGVNGEIKVIRE